MNYSANPKFISSNPDLQMLWHSSYYDGPIDGVAFYKGEPVWFSLIDLDGWMSLSELSKDYPLSEIEIDSIKTKEELEKILPNIIIEEGHWCKDTVYAIYKLNLKEFEMLKEEQNILLEYGFKNDHRPEYKNYQPKYKPEDYFKLEKSKRKKPNYLEGEKLGEYRWFEFKNYKRNSPL